MSRPSRVFIRLGLLEVRCRDRRGAGEDRALEYFFATFEQVRIEQEQWEERVEAAPRQVVDQEKLLTRLKQLFHPNHNLCMDVMFNLTPLYGVRGGKAEDLVAEAEKKEKMCSALLSTMEQVIPGGFRMRGMLLVELHTTKLFLLRTKLETKQSSKSQFVRNVASLRFRAHGTAECHRHSSTSNEKRREHNQNAS